MSTSNRSEDPAVVETRRELSAVLKTTGLSFEGRSIDSARADLSDAFFPASASGEPIDSSLLQLQDYIETKSHHYPFNRLINDDLDHSLKSLGAAGEVRPYEPNNRAVNVPKEQRLVENLLNALDNALFEKYSPRESIVVLERLRKFAQAEFFGDDVMAADHGSLAFFRKLLDENQYALPVILLRTGEVEKVFHKAYLTKVESLGLWKEDVRTLRLREVREGVRRSFKSIFSMFQ